MAYALDFFDQKEANTYESIKCLYLSIFLLALSCSSVYKHKMKRLLVKGGLFI